MVKRGPTRLPTPRAQPQRPPPSPRAPQRLPPRAPMGPQVRRSVSLACVDGSGSPLALVVRLEKADLPVWGPGRHRRAGQPPGHLRLSGKLLSESLASFPHAARTARSSSLRQLNSSSWLFLAQTLFRLSPALPGLLKISLIVRCEAHALRVTGSGSSVTIADGHGGRNGTADGPRSDLKWRSPGCFERPWSLGPRLGEHNAVAATPRPEERRDVTS